MKVNYVSVTKEYVRKSKEEKLVIRASMDINPSPLWFKQFQLFWISSPGLLKLCPEPNLRQNVISVSISKQEDIMATINTLIDLINRTKASYIIQDNPAFLFGIKEQII